MVGMAVGVQRGDERLQLAPHVADRPRRARDAVLFAETLRFVLRGVDPADAPGVGTPSPGGLSLRESHLICEAANASGKLLGMEMVEINPSMDVRNQTGKLAVWLVLSALGKTIL